MYFYYHNPRCSKSRAGLEILNNKGITFEIKEYLKDGLNFNEVKEIYTLLALHPYDLIRKKEKTFIDLGHKKDDLDFDGWCKLVAENPTLFERPLLKGKTKAIIGRPPENLLNII